MQGHNFSIFHIVLGQYVHMGNGGQEICEKHRYRTCLIPFNVSI